jgi:hypothetical protein
LHELSHGTEAEERWSVGYFLPEDAGQVEVTYFAHRTTSELAGATPGRFSFLELWAHPAWAGVNNDQLADAYQSRAETVLRDLRLRFARRAFTGDKIDGRWFIGWRRVAHQRIASARYFAIAPELPPLNSPDPRPELVPAPDLAELESRYEGRGPDVGLHVDFDLWQNRITLETELSLAILRGKINHFYRSLNALYINGGDPVLGPPDEPYDAVFANPSNLSQSAVEVDLRGDSLSTTSQVVEAQIGFRYKVLGWFHVQAGFRSARYDDVGVDLRPEPEFGWSYSGLEENDRSATYEGYYASVTLFVF